MEKVIKGTIFGSSDKKLNISDVSDSRKKLTDLLETMDSNMEMLRENNSNDNV